MNGPFSISAVVPERGQTWIELLNMVGALDTETAIARAGERDQGPQPKPRPTAEPKLVRNWLELDDPQTALDRSYPARRTMNRIDMTVSAVALTLALGLAAPRALAQFATDVQCAQCVGTTDIALRAITNGRLRDRDNAVTANKIRDGAVTAGKLSSDAVYLTSIVVSPVGPTEAYNCIELREALAGIVDNSASRPYSIYVEPGIYDCGFQPLSITSYVKVGGAGPGYTILKGAVDVSFVVMDEASELAHLTIINFGAGGIRSRGVSISDNVRLIGLSISASGGIKNNTAIFLRGATGVYMRNVDAVANGGGVSAVVNGLQASAQSEVVIDGSRFEGANSSSMKSNGIRIFMKRR